MGEAESCNVFQLCCLKGDELGVLYGEERFNTGVAWGLADVVHTDVKREVRGDRPDLNEVVALSN